MSAKIKRTFGVYLHQITRTTGEDVCWGLGIEANKSITGGKEMRRKPATKTVLINSGNSVLHLIASYPPCACSVGIPFSGESNRTESEEYYHR